VMVVSLPRAFVDPSEETLRVYSPSLADRRSCLRPAASAQNHEADLKTAFCPCAASEARHQRLHWFSQNAQDYSAHHTDTETTPEDIAIIAKLGFDNVRLSVDATPLEQSPRGVDGLNAEFMTRLDRALDTILADGMAVQVDLHPKKRTSKAFVRTTHR